MTFDLPSCHVCVRQRSGQRFAAAGSKKDIEAVLVDPHVLESNVGSVAVVPTLCRSFKVVPVAAAADVYWLKDLLKFFYP